MSAGVAILYKPIPNDIAEWTVVESRAVSVMFRLKNLGDIVFTSHKCVLLGGRISTGQQGAVTTA